MPGSLLADVRTTVSAALGRAPSPEIASALRQVLAGVDGPLRVAVAGRPGSGKSTFINAFARAVLAPTDGMPNKIPVWYRYGPEPEVVLQDALGETRQVNHSVNGSMLSVDPNVQGAMGAVAMVVSWPAPALSGLAFVELPPSSAPPPPVDALIYVFRSLDAHDLEYLEEVRQAAGERATALNTLAVVTGADLLGADAIDSLDQAREQAAMNADQLHHLCNEVIPLAGRVAQTSELLGDEEFHAFRMLAGVPADERINLLSTPASFAQGESSSGLAPPVRQAMIAMLGLFGVRQAVGLIADEKKDSAIELGQALAAASGMVEVRAAVQAQLVARREVLKARAALLALDNLARAHPEMEILLTADIERVESRAHELTELRLLEKVRGGVGDFRLEEIPEIERLLGAEGAEPRQRLGLSPYAGIDAVRDEASAAVARWQRRAESPMSSKDGAEAARVLVRTCEGIVEALGGRPGPAA